MVPPLPACRRVCLHQYRGHRVRLATVAEVIIITVRGFGQGQRLERLAPLRPAQSRDPAQPLLKLRNIHRGLLSSEVGTITGTNKLRHKSQKQRLEQDHRGVKGRYRPMRGFKNFDAAHRFCRAFEVRNFLRPTSTINQSVSLARRQVIHVQRVAALRDLISAALYSLW
jgi:putative transposase